MHQDFFFGCVVAVYRKLYDRGGRIWSLAICSKPHLSVSKRIRILGMQDPRFLHPTLCVKPWDCPFSILNALYCQYNVLLLVSKLKPTLPCYLPYPDAFLSVIVPCIDPACRADIVRLLKLGWRLNAIVEQLHVS